MVLGLNVSRGTATADSRHVGERHHPILLGKIEPHELLALMLNVRHRRPGQAPDSLLHERHRIATRLQRQLEHVFAGESLIKGFAAQSIASAASRGLARLRQEVPRPDPS